MWPPGYCHCSDLPLIVSLGRKPSVLCLLFYGGTADTYSQYCKSGRYVISLLPQASSFILFSRSSFKVTRLFIATLIKSSIYFFFVLSYAQRMLFFPFFLINVFLFIAGSGVTTNPCKNSVVTTGNTQFHSHPDPAKFIQCDIAGNAYVLACPSGLVWNEFSTTCVSPFTQAVGASS